MNLLTVARKAVVILTLALFGCALWASPLSAQTTQNAPDESARLLTSFNVLHTAKLGVIDARVAHAQTHRAAIAYQVQQQRRLDATQLAAELTLRDRDRYLQGESKKQRIALQAEIQLTVKRHEQIAERLMWSERLANEGLISQAELKLDKAAFQDANLTLQSTRDRLRVFESSTYPRMKLQVDAELAAAETEMAGLQQLAASIAQEFKVKERVAKEAHDDAESQIKPLADVIAREESDAKSSPAKITPTTWRMQKRLAALAQAELQRAETEAATQKQLGESDIQRGKQLLAVAELELEEFLKSKRAAKRQETLAKIRTISKALSKAQQQLDWSKRVVRKRYITRFQLKVDQLAVQQQQAALQDAQLELKILDEHTLRRDRFELGEKVAIAQRDLQRRQRLSAALLEEATVVAQARRDALKLQRHRLQQLAKLLPGGKSTTAGGG